MVSVNSKIMGESRFSNPTSRLHRNFDRFLGGLEINGQHQLDQVSENSTITATNPHDFSGRVRSWQNGNVLLTHCRGDSVTFHRTVRHLGDHFNKYVQIAVINEGSARSIQRGFQANLQPNSIVTLLLSEEFISRTTDGMDIFLFYIPRSYLESRGVNTHLMAARVVQEAAIAEPIRTIVDWAFKLQSQEDHAPRGYIERALLELLTSMCTGLSEGFLDMDAHSVAVRAQVLNIIETSFTNAETSVAAIAQSLGFSRRHIYRLFEGRDVSLARMIKERRLDWAEHLLRLPARMTLSEIARASGFSGPDQLSRAFRERRGVSPLAYRSGIKLTSAESTKN